MGHGSFFVWNRENLEVEMVCQMLRTAGIESNMHQVLNG